MAGNRLNVLAVGASPHLLYYSWKLQSSSKFNIHTISKNIDTSRPISILDDNYGDFEFKPDILANSLDDLTEKVKYDIFLISSKSLQDISNVANSLTPLLNKNSIILVESTGFINLEPFLKNCLPSNLQLSVFSIMFGADIRFIEQNKYMILNRRREIYIGESNTNSSKYSKSTQQNLNALSKLFQYDNKDEVKVILKATFLEFLIEQWKIAIPKICFDPLLIIFEEKNPSKLSNQILAKPLLSGLVTELITVAKTMGCKLPSGFDNESNFLKNWTSDYENRNSSVNVEYIQSPSLFYNLYHKIDLNIDLLLLQPILLADDYGIKTPYLEFLYATICQYEKLNSSNSSIFFQRLNETETNELKESLILKTSQYDQQKINLEKLKIQNQELTQNYDQLNSKFIDANNLLVSLEQLKSEKINLQQQLDKNEIRFQQLQKQIQSLENQLAQAQQNANEAITKAAVITASTAAAKAQPPQLKAPQLPLARSTQDLRKIMDQNNLEQQEPPLTQVSVNGTPDLRDLTDVAVYTSQFESPVPQQQAPPVQQNNENESPVTATLLPALKVPIPTQQSSREIELQRREQLLMNREMELNKKLSNINLNRGPNGAPIQQQFQTSQPSIQQFHPQHPHPQQPHVQQPHQQSLNPQFPLSPSQNLQARFNSQPQYPQAHHQLQPPAQPRRISTMPILESDQMYSNAGPGGMNHQGVKATSRKNRKSSFPLISTTNIGDGFNNRVGYKNNNGPPRNGGVKRYPQPHGRANSMMSTSMLNSHAPQNGYAVNNNHIAPSHGQQHQPQQPLQQPQQSLAQPPKVPNSMSFHGSSSSLEEQSHSNSQSHTSLSNGSRSYSVNQLSSQELSQPQPQPLSHSASRADLTNGSVIKFDSSDDQDGSSDEPKLLGVISDINLGKSHEEKKKFGLFKKKK